MAFRRFFSPSRSRSRDHSPSRSPKLPITVTHLHPPAGDFYIIPQCFMPPPVDGVDESTTLLNGRIEVTLAPGSGSRRIRSIKAGLVSTSTLDLGPGRREEEDIIFETSVDVTSSMVLDEGSHTFDWRVRVPRTLAAHDFHPEGRVVHTIFAEVEVISPSRSRSATRQSSPRPSVSGSRSRPPTRPPSPRPSISASPVDSSEQVPQSALPTGAQSPLYEDTVEKVVGKKTCMVIHENPNEGVINLDLPGDGVTPGLGAYHLRYMSEIWTICALFNYKLSVPNPSPLATIYAFAISLDQTTEITSPRSSSSAAQSITRTRSFDICGKGQPPAAGKVKQHWGALWTADGENARCEIEGSARMPNDEFCRPSTPPETKTPIYVSHHLILKVWFSVLGEDGYGNACDPTNTELRLLTLRRPVMIPSCALIPDIVELPSYDEIGETVAPVRTDDPCFLCDKYYSVKDYIALKQHRSGSIPQGECKLCGRKIVLGVKGAIESGMWRYCACGYTVAEMQERMRRVEATTPRGEPESASGDVQPKQEYGR